LFEGGKGRFWAFAGRWHFSMRDILFRDVFTIHLLHKIAFLHNR